MHKARSIRVTANFSGEIMQAKKQWDDTFKVLMEKDCQPKSYI
jgi:hypothetical protein